MHRGSAHSRAECASLRFSVSQAVCPDMFAPRIENLASSFKPHRIAIRVTRAASATFQFWGIFFAAVPISMQVNNST